MVVVGLADAEDGHAGFDRVADPDEFARESPGSSGGEPAAGAGVRGIIRQERSGRTGKSVSIGTV